MTKAQALALLEQCPAAGLACTVSVSAPATDTEAWTLALPAAVVYTGDQLGELVEYCEQAGVRLTAQFSAVGIV